MRISPHLTKIDLTFFRNNRLIWKFQDRSNPRIFGGSGTPILTICRYFLIKIWSNFWNFDLTVIPKRLLPNDSYPIDNIQVSDGITTSNNIVLKHFSHSGIQSTCFPSNPRWCHKLITMIGDTYFKTEHLFLINLGTYNLCILCFRVCEIRPFQAKGPLRGVSY